MYQQQGTATQAYQDKQPEITELGALFVKQLEENSMLLNELTTKVNMLSTMPENPAVPMKEKSIDSSFCAHFREALDKFASQNSRLQSIVSHLNRVI